MRTLTCQVLIEFISILLLALAGMTLMIVLFLIAREALEQGLGLQPILRLIPYVLPDAMRFAVPGTVLLAATSIYGRMSSANEVVAIKSLGISPMVIFWPTFVVAAFISLATVWLNDIAVSWGKAGVQRVVIESVEQIAYGMLKTQRTYSNKNMTIHVRGVEGQRLIQPMITLREKAGKLSSRISAEEAQLRANLDEGTLTIQLLNPSVDHDDFMATSPELEQYVIPLSDFSRQGSSSTRASETPLSAIPQAVAHKREMIRSLRRENVTIAAYQMITGDFQALVDRSWFSRQERIRKTERTVYKLRTEPQRRWANGFSCLCFVLVGAPMAVRRRHGEFLASFFACFLPILLIYYPFLVYSVDRAKAGAWPPQGVWLGNIVIALWGCFLLRKVIRY